MNRFDQKVEDFRSSSWLAEQKRSFGTFVAALLLAPVLGMLIAALIGWIAGRALHLVLGLPLTLVLFPILWRVGYLEAAKKDAASAPFDRR